MVFLKTLSSEFFYIEVWFTDQNSKPIEIEDKLNITLVIKWCIIYKIRYSIEPRYQIFVKDEVVSISSKWTQKSLIGLKNNLLLCVQQELLQVHLKLLQKMKNEKTAKATDDLFCNKLADKITGTVSRRAPGTISPIDEKSMEILTERYVSP